MARVNKPLRLPPPESVQMGGHVYKVIVDGAQTIAQSRDGCCDPLTETIAINPYLPPSYKTSTLVHEMFELANMSFMAESMSHEDITRLGEAFSQVLFDFGIEIEWPS